MWYLQSDTLLLLTAFTGVVAACRKIWKNGSARWLPWLMPVAELLILFYISQRLALFYAAYLIMGLVCAELLFKLPPHTALFALFSAAATVPFFLSRSESFGVTLPFLFVSVGIAYQMLKLIDVYYHVHFARERIDWLVFINYMLFLPVFTAGPIFRYREFAAAFQTPVPLGADELTENFKRLIRGFFKKLVLAGLGMEILQVLLCCRPRWYLSLAITVGSYLILYCDLSGYSDIAIAFGRTAGFAVPENFKKPWLAPSFTQFWRCWHASLSNWIREHIFVLFGKRRLNRWLSAVLCLTTMVVMSLWHGFNPLYLAAGIYNGLLLSLENLLHLTTVNKRRTKPWVYSLRCIVVNFLFAVNTLVFLLTPEQIRSVFQGFVSS